MSRLAAFAATLVLTASISVATAAPVAGTVPDRAALDAYLYPTTPNEIRTDSALVIVDGRTVYERNREPVAKRHILWSVSKSVTSALIGIAVKDGKVRVSDSICQYFTELKGPLCAITVDHVLQWGSGLRWNEEYENAKNPLDSSVIQMLYGDGVPDAVRFVLKHDLDGEPGKQWRYSSGDSELLQGVLHRAYGDAEYRALPRKRLFDPLGMTETLWEADPAGNYGGASYVYASARSLAQLGLLYLNDGVWKGERLLPEGWVNYATRVSEAFATGNRKDHESNMVAGHHWWLNRVVPGFNPERPWPSAPEDAFAAVGHWGQDLVVIPSRHLVAVRLGDDRKRGYHLDEFLRLALGLRGGAQ